MSSDSDGGTLLTGQVAESKTLARDLRKSAAEPHTVRFSALVVSERLLVKVAEQMERFDADVSPAE